MLPEDSFEEQPRETPGSVPRKIQVFTALYSVLFLRARGKGAFGCKQYVVNSVASEPRVAAHPDHSRNCRTDHPVAFCPVLKGRVACPPLTPYAY